MGSICHKDCLGKKGKIKNRFCQEYDFAAAGGETTNSVCPGFYCNFILFYFGKKKLLNLISYL